eukprot:2785912-Amphidinium_carterae.1
MRCRFTWLSQKLREELSLNEVVKYLLILDNARVATKKWRSSDCSRKASLSKHVYLDVPSSVWVTHEFASSILAHGPSHMKAKRKHFWMVHWQLACVEGVHGDTQGEADNACPQTSCFLIKSAIFKFLAMQTRSVIHKLINVGTSRTRIDGTSNRDWRDFSAEPILSNISVLFHVMHGMTSGFNM